MQIFWLSHCRLRTEDTIHWHEMDESLHDNLSAHHCFSFQRSIGRPIRSMFGVRSLRQVFIGAQPDLNPEKKEENDWACRNRVRILSSQLGYCDAQKPGLNVPYASLSLSLSRSVCRICKSAIRLMFESDSHISAMTEPFGFPDRLQIFV
jgi:hypothetical protein